MNRRRFLLTTGAASAGLAFPKMLNAFSEDSSPAWRTYEVVTRVEVLKPSGITRIWVPAALGSETPFQKTLSNTFQAEGASAKLVESKADSLTFVSAEFPDAVKPALSVTSRISTQNIAVDLNTPRKFQPESSMYSSSGPPLAHALSTKRIRLAPALFSSRAIAKTSLGCV